MVTKFVSVCSRRGATTAQWLAEARPAALRTTSQLTSLLARVDDVGVHLLPSREGAHTEQTVLRLEPHLHAIGDERGNKRRHTNTEVDVVAVLQLLGRAADDLLATGARLALSESAGGGVLLALSGADGLDLDLLRRRRLHDAVHVDAREVDLHRVKGADGDDVLGLRLAHAESEARSGRQLRAFVYGARGPDRSSLSGLASLLLLTSTMVILALLAIAVAKLLAV